MRARNLPQEQDVTSRAEYLPDKQFRVRPFLPRGSYAELLIPHTV